MEMRQAKEHHLLLMVKNVLVGIDKFGFPHKLCDCGHRRGITSDIYNNTFHCHK